MSLSLNELCSMDEGDDCAFDQPCRFGHRVGTHAVYCHNGDMAVLKCRRTWFTAGKIKDEDCLGFCSRDSVTEVAE